jgi:hypothetical protein
VVVLLSQALSAENGLLGFLGITIKIHRLTPPRKFYR